MYTNPLTPLVSAALMLMTLAPPVLHGAIATNTAPANGLIEYHETTPPPGDAFCRTAQP
jgi:hypothetical protein